MIKELEVLRKVSQASLFLPIEESRLGPTLMSMPKTIAKSPVGEADPGRPSRRYRSAAHNLLLQLSCLANNIASQRARMCNLFLHGPYMVAHDA